MYFVHFLLKEINPQKSKNIPSRSPRPKDPCWKSIVCNSLLSRKPRRTSSQRLHGEVTGEHFRKEALGGQPGKTRMMATSQDTEKAPGWGSLASRREMKRGQRGWGEGWGSSRRPNSPVQFILQLFKQENNTPKEVFKTWAGG